MALGLAGLMLAAGTAFALTQGESSASHRPTTMSDPRVRSAQGHPTAADTGWEPTGVALTRYDGTEIVGKDIRSCLTIKAADVTIRASRIACAAQRAEDSGTMVVQQSTAYHPNLSGLTLTDVEITRPGGATGGADYGLLAYGKNIRLTRVLIHNVTSGVNLAGSDIQISASYIGGLQNISGLDHIDGVIASGGVSDVRLTGNTIEVPTNQTTPLALFPERGPNRNWHISGNRFDGGGYCVYVGYTKGTEKPNHDITFADNTFGRTFFPQCGANGPAAAGAGGGRFLDGASNVWRDNAFDDGETVEAP